MKEQLEFSDIPWELRHCCNYDSYFIEVYLWLKRFWKWTFFWKLCFRGNSVLWKMLRHIVMLPLKAEKFKCNVLKEDLGEMETVLSVHHKKPLVSPEKLLCSGGIAAGWEKVSCPCRHCLWHTHCCWGVWSPLSCLHREENQDILGSVPSVPGSWQSIWGLPIIPSTNCLARVMEEGCRVSGHTTGASKLAGLA